MEEKFSNALNWLSELDTENPGVNYFVLTDLKDYPQDHPEVKKMREQVMVSGPVPKILTAQTPEGYWVEPGPGYAPKYTGTVWQLIFLAQLGADGSNEKVLAGCNYLLNNAISNYGGFSLDGRPTGMVYCLQGNLVAALLDLGQWEDLRLQGALEWLARSVTGDGIASFEQKDISPRYYKSGCCGPLFACSGNYAQSCAWGAVKVMLALGKVPENQRSRTVQNAIKEGLDFLLSHDPVAADYPMGENSKPSRSWFQFGYPLGYVTDILQNLEVLTNLLPIGEPRLQKAVEWLISKADSQGRWLMEYTYNGKTWAEIEKKGAPSKWVTLRALRVLKRYGWLTF